ncbi:membrane bound O-acyl transferase family-domain-containing protein [Roridomyces roridus]|uniref:Membrane bound O-acyl transferase family-domain-containing protein n=1 Tax=Roridomyces roridus TaxID=1738132 RepID=A0AAD7FLX9_9AGAR|nr:membrane bound O-acyl transferase family-domain-containing protein [Roridomyces roridus]
MSLRPFSPILLLIFHISFNIALALKVLAIRRLLFVPLCAILIYLLLNTSTGHLAQNWLTGHTLAVEMFATSDYILVTKDVHNELRPVKQLAPITDAPFMERYNWVSKLLLNPSGIGWLHEPTAAIPPKPVSSRRAFLLAQAFRLAFYALLLDGAGRATRFVPVLHTGSRGLGSEGLLQQFLSVSLFWTILYAAASLRGCCHRLFFVGANLWNHHDCPDLFNSWEHIYTLRSFWGKFWHQTLRRIFVSHARWLAHRVMGLQPGSQLSAYVQLFAAFFVSGLIHSLGQYMLTRQPSRGPLVFSMTQAMGITLEDFLVTLGKRLGFRGVVWKVVGVVWVVAWFTVTTPIWMDNQIKAGLLDPEVGGMSIKFAALGDLFIKL